jgi:hypothetical protein
MKAILGNQSRERDFKQGIHLDVLVKILQAARWSPRQIHMISYHSKMWVFFIKCSVYNGWRCSKTFAVMMKSFQVAIDE